MSNKKVTICVDALGADDAPSVVLDGVKKALDADENLSILLAGPKDVIKDFTDANDRCVPLYSTQAIEMGEHPSKAVRKKRNSSIVLGCKAVKESKADGFMSCGNTGACLAAATLFIGRIKGISRPMLATSLPSYDFKSQTLLADCGANADYKPEYIFQFGLMAQAFLKSVKNINNPRIAMLNIGEEEEKGSMLAQQSHALLKEKLKSFTGNAEGKDLLAGKFDAVITDGYSGNIALKSMEGSIKAVFKMLKSAMLSDTKSKIGAALLKGSIKDMIGKINPDEIGAALLMGVNKICCVGHGSSNANAVCSAILLTAKYARSNLVDEIKGEIDNLNL